MNQNQTCSDQPLLAMLGDELDQTASLELFEHVSECRYCQERVEFLAAPESDWSEAVDALQGETVGLDEVTRSDASEVSDSIVKRLLSQPTHPELLGRLERYDVERLIGVGGMGVVFKAYDSELSRPVAIKVLAPYLMHHATARQRFSREARAAAAVVHQHVVPIHDVKTEGELPYLVMHYVAGESLQSRIHRQGAMELKEVLRIGIQIADGLAAAHQQGLVHRDIKPANILLENASVDRALITDFGLARAKDDVQMTRTGTFMGTPRYMSPEQTCGEAIDQRSDLFSLGSVLYAMCTGVPAFKGDSPFVVMKQIGEETPKPIQSLNPEIPAWFCAIIQKLHAKSPDERFDDATQLRDLLQQCLRHVQQPDQNSLPKDLIPSFDQKVGKQHRAQWTIAKWVLATVAFAALVIAGTWMVQLNSNSNSNAKVVSNAADGSLGEIRGAAGDEPSNEVELLGFGFSRRGNSIWCDGMSIESVNTNYRNVLNEYGIRKFELPERLARDIDAASFRAMSELYAKDKNWVYFKEKVGKAFLLLKLPVSEPSTFEVVSKALARDRNGVWYYGALLEGVDPAALKVVVEDRVWKDEENVWYGSNVFDEADASTFEHIDGEYFRDAQRVYWATAPIDQADPLTFRTFGEGLPYGRDRDSVWHGRVKLKGVDANSFQAIHENIYKDKNAVYVDGRMIPYELADHFRKLADLNGPAALFQGEVRSYVYLGTTLGIFEVKVLPNEELKIQYDIYNRNEEKVVGQAKITMTEQGWKDLDAPKEFKDQMERHFSLFRAQFEQARFILKEREKTSTAESVDPKCTKWSDSESDVESSGSDQ